MAVSALYLPKTLMNMLSTLVQNNELNSWNIFSTRHGVCVNIRFVNAKAGSHSPSRPVFYRRQTARQVIRNRDRAHKHKHDKHNLDTLVNTSSNPSIPKETEHLGHISKTEFSTPGSVAVTSHVLPPPLTPSHSNTPPSPPATLESKKRKIDLISPELMRTEPENIWSTHIGTPELLTHIHNETATDSSDEHLDDTLDDIIRNNYDCDIKYVHPPVVNPNSHPPLPEVTPSSVSVPHPPYPPEPPDQTLPPDPSSPTNIDDPSELSILYLAELLRRWDQTGNLN
jgi:hypothetical protein